MTKYVLGMDCGGTRIQASAYNLLGEEILSYEGGPSNLIADYDQAIRELQKAVLYIDHVLDKNKCQLAVLGISGLDVSGAEIKLRAYFQSLKIPISLMNDAKFSYWNRLQGKEGILVLSGTGSVIYGRFNKEWYRVGGWGDRLGDEGSAYWIGKQCVKSVLDGFDTGVINHTLTKHLYQFWEVNTPCDLVQKFYQSSKQQIASISKSLLTLAEQNHFEVLSIFNKAGYLLAQQAFYMSQKIPQDHYYIAINGSVIEHNQWVKHAFQKHLEEQIDVTYVDHYEKNAKAAYYFWLKEQEHY